MRKSILLYTFIPVFSAFSFVNLTNFHQENVSLNKQEVSCTDCHKSLIESKTVHAPASGSCESCHQVNIKDHTEKGAKGLNLADKVPALCFTCHDAIKNTVDSSVSFHQAMNGSKSCIACHSPHSSNESKLLVKEEKALCLSCHNKDMINGKKVVNIDNVLKSSKVVHAPVDGGCVTCHKPHGSQNGFLLQKPFPTGQYSTAAKDSFSLCWDCHDADLMKAEKTTSATSFRNGDKNLHFVHMNGDKSRTCVMCHNVHGAPNAHLIADKVPFGQWNMPLKYTVKESGGSCAPGCHGLKEYNR